jgi:hypothetical protein
MLDAREHRPWICGDLIAVEFPAFRARRFLVSLRA